MQCIVVFVGRYAKQRGILWAVSTFTFSHTIREIRLFASVDLQDFLSRLATSPAVLVSVVQGQGSVPRENGAWMAVFPDAVVGTIGGGQLEWAAMRQARAWLTDPAGRAAVAWEQREALGPSLGQCCGGVVVLRFEPVDHAQAAELRQRLATATTPVGLFGGGHVGRAIVQALAPLPFSVSWIDSRDEIFPADVPDHVRTEHSDPVQAAVWDLPPGSLVLIMSFSHAQDLDVVAACLERQRQRADLPFVGLIGSRTKWATFAHRLRERGWNGQALAHITSPIGIAGISGKQPAVIAAAVVAQMLLVTSSAAEAVGEEELS